MTVKHHNCPSCGRVQLDEYPSYPQGGTIPERLRAMAELYDPTHVTGGCNWCTDVGAARLMREAATALDTYRSGGIPARDVHEILGDPTRGVTFPAEGKVE